MQYRMPDAYDQDGGVNQEKRFSVAMQRYRLFSIKKTGYTYKFTINDTIQATDVYFVKF